jgi:hypothetical protein
VKDFSEARQALKGLKSIPKAPEQVKWCEPWTEVDCPLECGGIIYVDMVNEDYLEESGINPDFVEGDNWVHDGWQKDHKPYVPDHHIFLSSGIFKIGPKKVIKTFTHEFVEVIAMSHGLTYDESHENFANPAETKIGEVVKAETEG